MSLSVAPSNRASFEPQGRQVAASATLSPDMCQTHKCLVKHHTKTAAMKASPSLCHVLLDGATCGVAFVQPWKVSWNSWSINWLPPWKQSTHWPPWLSLWGTRPPSAATGAAFTTVSGAPSVTACAAAWYGCGLRHDDQMPWSNLTGLLRPTNKINKTFTQLSHSWKMGHDFSRLFLGGRQCGATILSPSALFWPSLP